MFKIGIIGCGKISQVRHIPEYADNADAKLDGCLLYTSRFNLCVLALNHRHGSGAQVYGYEPVYLHLCIYCICVLRAEDQRYFQIPRYVLAELWRGYGDGSERYPGSVSYTHLGQNRYFLLPLPQRRQMDGQTGKHIDKFHASLRNHAVSPAYAGKEKTIAASQVHIHDEGEQLPVAVLRERVHIF